MTFIKILVVIDTRWQTIDNAPLIIGCANWEPNLQPDQDRPPPWGRPS